MKHDIERCMGREDLARGAVPCFDVVKGPNKW